MRPVAYILGGFGTKLKHLKTACKIYEKNNIEVKFLKTDEIFWMSPKIFKKKAKLICNSINKDDKFFLHGISAGYLQLYEINKNIGNKPIGNIIESGPGILDSEKYQDLLKETTKIHIPKFFLEKSLKISGYTYWEENEHNNHIISNGIVLIGKNDKYVDFNNLNSYIENNKKIKKITFDNSSHCNIQKNDKIKYEKVLDNFIKRKLTDLNKEL